MLKYTQSGKNDIAFTENNNLSKIILIKYTINSNDYFK